MGNIFAGSELVEIGIQIEINGKDFYEEIAVQSKDKKVKDLFLFLSGEENDHIKKFQGILDSVQKYEPAEAYPGEYFAYMSSLASQYVFTKKDQGRVMAQKVNSETDAIELGIGLEKDSILFYEGMKTVVPEYDRKIVDALIAQEKKHLSMLFELKKGAK
jgi:rubrerythrin